MLTNTNDINGAIEFGEEALKKISGLNRKGNANEYIIATSLATLYAGNILIPQPYEVRKKGLALYQRALDIALENYGEYSVETATIYLKLGNYYMRMEEERSFDKAKHWLHKAFNSRLIDSLSTNKYQTKQLIEIFASSYPLFSILNDEEYFLQTAKKITQTNSFSFCENHLLMESMAEAYKAYNIGKYDKAISIYQQLINCCPEKQSKQCLSYIKSKAFTEYLNQEYDKAIADYLSIKDIMADKTVEPSISAYAQMLDLLSNCYQRINDSIQSRKYEDLSLKLREEAIQTNDGGNSALYWYKKAALNKDIGELQKSIAEAAIERLEEAGFNGQNTLLKMIPDYKPFYTAPSESEQKSMHESVRNSTVEWGKTIGGEASLGQTQNDEINGFRVEFKEDNIKIGFTKNSEFTLFIYIQEDDIIVKNGSENGVEYNRNTGKPYMLLRPYSYEIEAKEYPGQIFERTNYTNGNKYWGETYNGQRHGYGIHIWENGDMWFGPWKDGERNGYGAYFDITAHTIQSGKWIGNELIAGTSYICKEKAEPVLPARTRTVSKPFSYSGTVRYINLPTSSYMSYITEAINKWGKCRTGAITMYGAGVGVYGNSGYAYTGSTPSKLKKRIEEANSSNAEITDINITENGNYVIILGGSGYWTLGYPDAFLKKLEQYRTGDLRDDNILSACFNDRGEWVVITDKHYSYSNETIKNFILKAEELYEEVYYAYITNYGMIACCKNGVYYKNIPSNLAEALKKLTFKPKVIKFTDNGLYLITDGESQNYYFM